MPDRIIYAPLDRPPAWVEDDGHWWRGRIHSWHRRPSGWVAIASWHVGIGLQKYLDVPAERLKPGDEADPNVADEGDVVAPWET